MSEAKVKFSERLELIVFGYIRKQRLPLFPDALIKLVISFYIPTDKWDKNCMGNLMILNEHNNAITHSAQTGHQSAFLENVIDSGIIHWKFKLLSEGGDDWNSLIGIWKVHDPLTDGSDGFERTPPITAWFPSSGHAYTFWAQQGKKGGKSGYPDDGEYGIKCTKDDVIEMYLNMNEGLLGFIINDKDYGKAFDIDTRCQYRAVVSMWDNGTEIQLL